MVSLDYGNNQWTKNKLQIQIQIQKDLLVLFAKEEVLLSQIQELLRSREDGDELLLSARDSDGGTVLHALARAYLEHVLKILLGPHGLKK